MLALARVESGWMLRHPVAVAALLIFLGPWIYGWLSGGADRYPVLHDEAVGMQPWALLVLGGAALVIANLAVLREHRHHTSASYDVLIMPAPWRTAALLLAVLPYAGVVAVVVGIRIAVLAALPGAAGAVNPIELVTSPVVVALLGAAGVLLARLIRSAVVAPLAIVVFAVGLFFALADAAGGAAWAVLLPTVPSDLPISLPGGLVDRPATRHLAYLVGLVMIVAVAALARSGARSWWTVTAFTTGLALVVGAGAAQFIPDDTVHVARMAATTKPTSIQTCRALGGVTFCTFEDFAPWVSGWDDVVRGVLRPVPALGRTGPALAVRQRVQAYGYPTDGAVSGPADSDEQARSQRESDMAAGTPEAVAVGTSWGDDASEAVFAGSLAYRVVTGRAVGGNLQACGARGALIVWLAGQATKQTASGLRELDAHSWGALEFWDTSLPDSLSVPDRDAAAGLALLHRPESQVAPIIEQHWAELIAPGTSTDRFGVLLGVPVAPEPPLAERPVCRT
jgi:hypothetical protein